MMMLSKEEKLLLNEAGLSSVCVGQGLTVLRKSTFVNKWNYYQAFFLLSIGIERLLKIIIISKYKADNNFTFPKNNFLKSLGHDIKKLVEIVESYKINSEVIDNDIELLIIEFFTNFAKHNRYYNLDVISGIEKNDDPLREWKIIQDKIKDSENLKSKPLNPELLSMINENMIFLHHDEEGNPVTTAEDFLKDNGILDKLQGYSVYYIWQVIRNLVDKLRVIEYQHNLFPYLREFFPYFIKDWDKGNDINILKWKDWNYLK